MDDSFFPLSIPGITNYEEYSLIQETVEEKKEDGMGTLKKDRTLLRDERKMEKLKAKLHTDDDCEFSGIPFDPVVKLMAAIVLPKCLCATLDGLIYKISPDALSFTPVSFHIRT